MKEAKEHFQKAIELDKSSIESYLALGKLYLKVKLPRRAELQFQEVLKWAANNQVAKRLLESLSRNWGIFP